MLAEGSLTRHGFPRGYRFVPTQLELLSILSQYIEIGGGALDPPHRSIFHDIRILNYHPEELHERYKDDAEHRYIYFFSEREFQKAGAGVAVPEDKDQKEPRPVRVAKGGGWKPSGGGQVLRLPRKKGGFVAGRMVTMVFYDRGAAGGVVKSNWGMHEFVVPVDQHMTSPPTKYTRFHDLALYRLYILKSGDMESDNGAAASSSQLMPKGYDPYAALMSVPPCPPLQPWGIFTGNKALAAGTSTSQYMPPPQQQLPSAQHAHYYHHQQHAFVGTSTAAGAAQPHAHNTPVLGAALPHAHNMPVLGAGLPSNRRQCAVPPAPVPVPPAAAHQAPAAAMHGAGQDTSHFRTKRSPPSSSSSAIEISPTEQHTSATAESMQAQYYHQQQHASAGAAQSHAHNMPVLGAGLPSNLRQFAVKPAPVPVPPAAAHQANASAMHGAEQDTSHSGTKRSPPSSPSAIQSSPAEQHATATAESAQAQFVDCVKPMEVAARPPLLEDLLASPVKDEDAAVTDNYDGIEMPDWNNFDFTPFDDSFPNLEFTMEELLGVGGSMLDETVAMGGDDSNSGGENYGQAGATQQEPPAALSCY